MTRNRAALSALAVASLSLPLVNAGAQQVTGTLGSPPRQRRSATAIATPRSEFRRGNQGWRAAVQAVVGAARRAAEGRTQCAADHHRRRRLRCASAFGGVIPTPTMDRLAKEGLRYNRVFSTALCSPTRAALITGRNHHSVGFGVISEQSTGFPATTASSTVTRQPSAAFCSTTVTPLRGSARTTTRRPLPPARWPL